MRRRWRWIGGVLAVVVVVVAASLLVVRFAKPPAEPPPETTAEPQTPTGTVKFLMEQQWTIRMKLALVRPGVVAQQITATGRVVPAAGRQAVVAPPVSGIITGTAFPRVGQQVKKGATLAVLRQTPTAAELAQVEAGQAQVHAAEAQTRLEQVRFEAERRRMAEAVNETELRRNQARRELERARRLHEQKAYSQRQLEAAEVDAKTAESTHAATIAQRDALVAPRAVSSTPVRLVTSYTMASPISGTVVKVHKALGAQVGAGEPIVEIIDLSTVWVEAPIFERDLHRLAPPVRAAFSTPAYPRKEFTGTLVDLGAVIDPQSRAATALFQVANSGRALRIGMQANVRLDAGETVQALMIPREAVLDHEGKKIVYVLITGEEFQRREVTLGDEYGETVAVLSGLKAGERVVTQGAYQMRLQELRPAAPGAHTHET